MREPHAKTIHLKDYTPPAFLIDAVDLDVDIRDDHALVRARSQVSRNAGSGRRWCWMATNSSWFRSPGWQEPPHTA